jgi:CheY-like chemotaxis protein
MNLHQIPVPEAIHPILYPQDDGLVNADPHKKSPLKQKRISLIGKDIPTLKIISETIKNWRGDLELMTVSDSFEAGKVVANGAPNLVIIDLSDSQKEHYFILEKIRQDKNCTHTKILALKSGPIYDLPESIHLDGTITKPIDLYKLTAQVKQLL